jgi:hypothetical protein
MERTFKDFGGFNFIYKPDGVCEGKFFVEISKHTLLIKCELGNGQSVRRYAGLQHYRRVIPCSSAHSALLFTSKSTSSPPGICFLYLHHSYFQKVLPLTVISYALHMW